jgi:hypothetical protein
MCFRLSDSPALSYHSLLSPTLSYSLSLCLSRHESARAASAWRSGTRPDYWRHYPHRRALITGCTRIEMNVEHLRGWFCVQRRGVGLMLTVKHRLCRPCTALVTLLFYPTLTLSPPSVLTRLGRPRLQRTSSSLRQDVARDTNRRAHRRRSPSSASASRKGRGASKVGFGFCCWLWILQPGLGVRVWVGFMEGSRG